MKFTRQTVFGGLIFLVFISCSKDNSTNTIPEGNAYPVPEQKEDGWTTASLTDVGIDQTPLIAMIDFINSTAGHQINDILIIKNNKLVFEEYFKANSYVTSPPAIESNIITYNMDMLHYWASVSKSVTSVLFGIAIDKGFIDKNVNEKISAYLPGYSSILTGEKADITVKNLLTMSSGLDWDETSFPYGNSKNDVTGLFTSNDPIRFVLSKNLHGTPGTIFHYNSGVTHVLAEIIRQKSQMNLLKFAEEYLFQPLGITKYEWQKIRGDYYFASGGLNLRPRDMAKIGSLFLNAGKWKGVQVVSEEWVHESTQNYIVPDVNFATGYGYQWWFNSVTSAGNKIDFIMAAGLGEQLMFIIPSSDLIIVFNCGYFGIPVTLSPYQLIDDYIARAIFHD
jgi:CubicO group peptidase (beta-lactamase class C family)